MHPRAHRYYPGNDPWKLVDGLILFECGKYGWDAAPAPGVTVPPWWVDFDFGTPTSIDGIGLWSDGGGGWDVSRFNLATAPTLAGPWTPVSGPAGFQAQVHDGGLQVFGGFQATAQHWRWNISTTGGHQPWVKEVQFRQALK